MSLNESEINQLKNSLNRISSINLIYPKHCTKNRLICRTSASSIFIKLSNKGIKIVWDDRLTEFIMNSFWGILNFDNEIIVEGKTTLGSFHLESTMLCCLAERALNPYRFDPFFSLSILLNSFSFIFKSMPILTTHSLTLKLSNSKTEMIVKIFELFIEARICTFDNYDRKQRNIFII